MHPSGRFRVAPERGNSEIDASHAENVDVKIPVQLGTRQGKPAEVVYRWDADTDILSAQLRPMPAGNGSSGSVEIEGADGSWIIFDLRDECVCGIEIAVWPDVSKRGTLGTPGDVREASVRLPGQGEASGVTSLEVETPMAAESDMQGRVFHFRFGGPRETSAVRVARDLLFEVDATNHVAGLWLLNVPPFPQEP
jgi:hypothetical protein